VVARVRRLAGQKRVGHAGTLDPLATGVLPVLLGRATRLMNFVQAGQKSYIAEISLGTATDTDDAEGVVIASGPVPFVNETFLEETLSRFVGEILQTPPKYSALKIGGQRAYALARTGAEPVLAARPVTISALTLLDYSPSTLRLEVVCSKGTYVRALARDIATALGTVGHMSSLLRTRVGPFAVDDAVTLDGVAVRDALRPASQAIPDAPEVTASADEARRLANGQPVPANGLQAEHVWVYDPDGQLLCLASASGAQLQPRIAL
jgi:tRNA pseudouridine55 synthase